MTNKISAGTVARTAVLALALTNQILSATGHSPLPIESEQLEQIITTGITVVASLVAWWRTTPSHLPPSTPITSSIRCRARSKEQTL